MKLFAVILAVLALSGCANEHPDFMKRAVVGNVDGQYSIVMFPAGERNGIKYYRPQFASECPYNKIYQTDSNSVSCYIRESRITGLRGYYEPRVPNTTNRTLDHVIPDNGTVE